jgi:hypothetical protein
MLRLAVIRSEATRTNAEAFVQRNQTGQPWPRAGHARLADRAMSKTPMAGRHLQGWRLELAAARRRDPPHGPDANQLWRHIEERAATFTVAGAA